MNEAGGASSASAERHVPGQVLASAVGQCQCQSSGPVPSRLHVRSKFQVTPIRHLMTKECKGSYLTSIQGNVHCKISSSHSPPPEAYNYLTYLRLSRLELTSRPDDLPLQVSRDAQAYLEQSHPHPDERPSVLHLLEMSCENIDHLQPELSAHDHADVPPSSL